MITPNDLKKALQKENDSIGNLKLNEMIDYMINEVDIDEDGKINFHEFVTIMMAL
jgi:Ca2+-binding EF-hand superfamily protein